MAVVAVAMAAWVRAWVRGCVGACVGAWVEERARWRAVARCVGVSVSGRATRGGAHAEGHAEGRGGASGPSAWSARTSSCASPAPPWPGAACAAAPCSLSARHAARDHPRTSIGGLGTRKIRKFQSWCALNLAERHKDSWGVVLLDVDVEVAHLERGPGGRERRRQRGHGDGVGRLGTPRSRVGRIGVSCFAFEQWGWVMPLRYNPTCRSE